MIDLDSKKYHSRWESVTDGVPQGYIHDSLLFLLYINDIRNVVSDTDIPELYADDTSLIITSSDRQIFEKDINTAILQLYRWFKSNLLLLNLEKNLLPSTFNKNTNATDPNISCENKQTCSIYSIKF